MSALNTVFFMTAFVLAVSVGYYAYKCKNRRQRTTARVSKRQQQSHQQTSYTRDAFLAQRRPPPLKQDGRSISNINEAVPLATLVRIAAKMTTNLAAANLHSSITSMQHQQQQHKNNSGAHQPSQQQAHSKSMQNNRGGSNQHQHSNHATPIIASLQHSPKETRNGGGVTGASGQASSQRRQASGVTGSVANNTTNAKTLSISLDKILGEMETTRTHDVNNNYQHLKSNGEISQVSEIERQLFLMQVIGSVSLSEQQIKDLNEKLKQLVDSIKKDALISTQNNQVTIDSNEQLQLLLHSFIDNSRIYQQKVTADDFIKIIEAFCKQRKTNSVDIDAPQEYRMLALLCIKLRLREWTDFLLADMQANNIDPDRLVLDEYLTLLSNERELG